MTIRVLVNGAFGRMGQLATKSITDHPGLELVGQTGREYDLKKAIQDSHADVVVDFTTAEAVFNNTKTILDAGARPVIGTSGLNADNIKALKTQATKLKLGGIVVPNFSIGGVLMMKYAREIAKYMPHVEIIEMHHDGKADSPSGTAIHTAELIAEANPAINQPAKTSRENLAGARGAQLRNVPIHAIRLPGLLAHQAVLFGATGETLTLRHDSIDRQCFMAGVCLACEKVMTLNHFAYGLEEVL